MVHIKDHSGWDFDKSRKALASVFKTRLEVDRSLKELTTLRTGGPAKLFLEVNSSPELAEAVRLVNELAIPLFMLGGGSNLLVSDNGFNGLVIKNSIKGMRCQKSLIICGAGESLEDLIDFSAERELTGLEFASGIWGTVGGAVYGNAGAYGGEISSVLSEVEVIDKKGVTGKKRRSEIRFDYRWSEFKTTGEYIASAKFALKKGKKSEICGRIEEILSIRKSKLPYDKHTAGCVFKNIPDPGEAYGKLSAGKLLEEAEAKNLSCGDARVSEKHANIIFNEGGASSSEIKRLADMMKRKVKGKFDIDLTEEIVLLGEF